MDRVLFNPFPGLRPFEPDEDHLFFGREREIDDLLHRLGSHRFLAVVGSSGSGKSSLVRSGLIPSLHGGFISKGGSSWRIDSTAIPRVVWCLRGIAARCWNCMLRFAMRRLPRATTHWFMEHGRAT